LTHRIALLVDSMHVGKPTRDLVDWIKAQPDMGLVALLVHPAPQSSLMGIGKFRYLAKTQGLYTALSRTAFALMSRLEQAVTMRAPHYRAHCRSYDIGGNAIAFSVPPKVSPSGHVYRFGEPELDTIHRLNLDLIIREGNGILKGDILTAAKHGILSMHHGDNRINRGGPAGFWEVYHRQPETGFVIQRLTEELDGGEVLFRGSVRTDLTYGRNKANLYERSYPYLHRTIRAILEGRAPAEPPHIYSGRLYRTPLMHQSVRYVLGVAATIGQKLWRRLIGRKWNWGVAYLWGDWRDAVLRRARVIPNPHGSFLADPFAFEHEGQHFIFAEEFVYAKGRGVISVWRVDRHGHERIGVALDAGQHLSFPFVFRHDGEIYMTPETEGEGKATLYRCVSFPDRWEPVKVLAEGEIADTMMFEHGGKWWMMHTRRAAPMCGNVADMNLFYADSPLDDWTPHPMNPVVMDASKGRCGGLLRGDGGLYRVAQRHRFAQYGAGTGIYRIDVLSESDYRETLVQDVNSDFMPGIKGTHHFHHDGGLTVVDFVRDKRP
jgi:hypothetical protein